MKKTYITNGKNTYKLYNNSPRKKSRFLKKFEKVLDFIHLLLYNISVKRKAKQNGGNQNEKNLHYHRQKHLQAL